MRWNVMGVATRTSILCQPRMGPAFAALILFVIAAVGYVPARGDSVATVAAEDEARDVALTGGSITLVRELPACEECYPQVHSLSRVRKTGCEPDHDLFQSYYKKGTSSDKCLHACCAAKPEECCVKPKCDDCDSPLFTEEEVIDFGQCEPDHALFKEFIDPHTHECVYGCCAHSVTDCCVVDHEPNCEKCVDYRFTEAKLKRIGCATVDYDKFNDYYDANSYDDDGTNLDECHYTCCKENPLDCCKTRPTKPPTPKPRPKPTPKPIPKPRTTRKPTPRPRFHPTPKPIHKPEPTCYTCHSTIWTFTSKRYSAGCYVDDSELYYYKHPYETKCYYGCCASDRKFCLYCY